LTGDSRVELATGYIELISERPILGHGTGFVAGRLQEAQARGPHNTFLSFWAENGLPGLAAYLTLLAVAFWYFRRLADRRGQALCAGAFVLSIFNNDVLDMRTFIVALGLLSVFAAPERFAGWERAQPVATRRFAGHAGAGRIGA
jgi:O-Antigen ligase